MRQTIASIIIADPLKYNEKSLGKNPQDYVNWLLKGSSSWGGIPELRVMSEYYNVEIGCVVIHDVEVLMFNH